MWCNAIELLKVWKLLFKKKNKAKRRINVASLKVLWNLLALSIQRVCSWLSACELANSQMMAHGFSILQNFSSFSTVWLFHMLEKKIFSNYILPWKNISSSKKKCSTVDLSKSANCMKFWTCRNRMCVYRYLINILWAHIKHQSRRQNQTFFPQHLHRAK